MSATFEQALVVARDLASENGENPEYDRALIELISALYAPSADPDDSRRVVAQGIKPEVVSPIGPISINPLDGISALAHAGAEIAAREYDVDSTVHAIRRIIERLGYSEDLFRISVHRGGGLANVQVEVPSLSGLVGQGTRPIT